MSTVDEVLERVAAAEQSARDAAITVGQHLADAAAYPRKVALAAVIAGRVTTQAAIDLARARLAGAVEAAEHEATAILTGGLARAEAAAATVAASARTIGATVAELARDTVNALPWSIRWAPQIVLGSMAAVSLAVLVAAVRVGSSPSGRRVAGRAAKALL